MEKSEELELLSELGVNPNTLSHYQILCLPENIDNRLESHELIDAEESITLSKRLKEQGIRCANSYDLNLSTKIAERRGFDLWLGTIWIVEHAALPLLISIIGPWIREILQKRSADSKRLEATQETEELVKAKVHANLRVIDKKISSMEIKFSGDADAFLKIIKAIENE